MVDDADGKRVTALDGVRGVAVLVVFLFHARALPAGYLGVYVFFVLSGFLITGRLFALVDRAELTPARRWGSFAMRRVARIFPLYYATLAILALDRRHLFSHVPGAAWPWLLTYTSNFTRFFVGESLGPSHFWSLCVEEQYYLVFPFLVLTPLRRWLGAIALGSIVGAVVMQVMCPWRQASELPFMHFNSFGAGVLAALVVRDGNALGISPRAFHAVGVAAWVAFAVWLAFPSTSPGFPGVSTALSFGTASVVLAMWSGTLRPLGAVLRGWPLVALGRISYGVYMVHPFVLPTMARAIPAQPVLVALLGFAVSIGIAALSFRFFEKPILAWAHSAAERRC